MTNPMNQPEEFIPLTLKIFGVILLLFVLMFVLTWTNTIPCKSIPGWCDLYYNIKGSISTGTISFDFKPKVAIVYGEDGLGNPALLQTMMSDREHFKYGARPDLLDIAYVNLGNLKVYDLIIVEHAKTMSTEKMKMFVDYVIQGGKLVWVADAGTLLSPEESKTPENYLLFEDELNEAANHKLIGPWARKYMGRVVLLNELLGVNYRTNYCSIKQCPLNSEFPVGMFVVPNIKNPFTYAFNPMVGQNLLYIYGLNDFSLVDTIPGKVSTVALSLDFTAKLIDDLGNDYGKVVPLIVSTAKANIIGWEVGKNVAYYALPPEYFAYSLLSEEHRFYSLLSNMYYAMLYG